jgi:hypothetical protein
MEALTGAFREQEQGYPAAGSFCGFVIETYGVERFKRLYAANDPAAAAASVLGKSLADLDADWREFLHERG